MRWEGKVEEAEEEGEWSRTGARWMAEKRGGEGMRECDMKER